MDSDDGYSDYEQDGTEPWDDLDNSFSKAAPFETLTTDDIVKLMNQYIEHVIAVVKMPATTTRILLSHTKWEKQVLLDKLTADDCNKFFEKANVLNPFVENSNSKQSTGELYECNICFSELSQDEFLNLGCGHNSCKDCWRQYLMQQIVGDGKSELIRCPATKCGVVIDDVAVMQLLRDEQAKKKYQYLMTNSFVEHNRSLRWCPSPGCGLAVKANQLLAYQKNCTCKCGYSFCFQCGETSHDPIPCALMENWRMNSNDLNVEYLTKNTKECPKCYAIIEKNGGCNRMICRKCNHPFCWLCYGSMETYNHRCNTYKEENTDRSNRNRWQHYFTRYSLHTKSLKYEEKLTDGAIKAKMNDMQAMGKSWNEVQFLVKAVNILCESRKQLMFTYIFAYYIEDHNQKIIFEANQSDLETATEALSQYLERNITKDNIEEITTNVMDKSSYCERRQKAMQEHIFEGFENDWWSFATNLWSRLKQMM